MKNIAGSVFRVQKAKEYWRTTSKSSARITERGNAHKVYNGIIQQAMITGLEKKEDLQQKTPEP